MLKKEIDSNIFKKVIKTYRKEYLKYKRLLFFNILFAVLFQALSMLDPIFFKKIVDIISNNSLSQDQKYFQALYFLFWLGIIYLLNFIVSRVVERLLISIEYKVIQDNYMKGFDYLQRHSYKFFADNFTGTLVRRISKFVSAGESLMDLFLFEFTSIIYGMIFMFIITALNSIYLFWFFVIWTIIYIFLQYYLYKSRIKYDIAANEQDSKVVGYLSDTITNNFNINIFSSLKREYSGFNKEVSVMKDLRTISFIKKTYIRAFNGIMFGILELGMFYLAIKFWYEGIFSVGTFFLLQTSMLNFSYRISSISNLFKRGFSLISDASEMVETFETPHEILDEENAQDLIISRGKIKFDNMGFYYKEGKYVFRDYNLEIKEGERVALVGVSGSGKTTISRLIMRLYDLQEGRILIDDQDISKVTQDSLRRQISLVPQEPVLFHRSIAENISYGKPNATKEEIIHAAKLARADEFVSRLENGYDALVGERGIKLSGGEKQRVAIARALLQNNKILILDEATSSLDSESEMYIQQAIEEVLKNRTAIVIAHRLSTIMKMDKIIVMQYGKIVEMGTHNELLQNEKGVYKKLWNIQSGGFLVE